MTMKKMLKKLEHQAKVNPGYKTTYEQPLRPRATVFSNKKAYNRQKCKRSLMYEN